MGDEVVADRHGEMPDVEADGRSEIETALRAFRDVDVTSDLRVDERADGLVQKRPAGLGVKWGHIILRIVVVPESGTCTEEEAVAETVAVGSGDAVLVSGGFRKLDIEPVALILPDVLG